MNVFNVDSLRIYMKETNSFQEHWTLSYPHYSFHQWKWSTTKPPADQVLGVLVFWIILVIALTLKLKCVWSWHERNRMLWCYHGFLLLTGRFVPLTLFILLPYSFYDQYQWQVLTSWLLLKIFLPLNSTVPLKYTTGGLNMAVWNFTFQKCIKCSGTRCAFVPFMSFIIRKHICWIINFSLIYHLASKFAFKVTLSVNITIESSFP